MESKEIIEDQLVSIISKDYLDVFSKNLLYNMTCCLSPKTLYCMTSISTTLPARELARVSP